MVGVLRLHFVKKKIKEGIGIIDPLKKMEEIVNERNLSSSLLPHTSHLPDLISLWVTSNMRLFDS